MKKNDYLIGFILFFTGLFSRLPLTEKIFSQWDGPLYALGIIHYSFEQRTPTFPGYPFYIGLGKFFYLFLNNPQNAILAVSVFGSAIGALVLYLIGKKMYSRNAGISAAIIFLTGSTFYYFGLTTYAYILTPITTSLLAYSVFRIFIKNKQEGLILGTSLGISIGVRPQEAIQIIVLFLLGFFILKRQEKIKSILAFILVTLLWLIPVMNAVGFSDYLKFLVGLKSYNVNAPVLQNIELMIKGFLLSFGVSCIFLMYFVFKYWKNWKKSVLKNSKIIIFYASWILPGLLINLLLRSDHAGYQMTYLSGFIFLIAFALWKLSEKKTILFFFLLTLTAAFNLYWFFYDRDPKFIKPYRPTSFHYSDIRKNDIKTGGKIDFIKSHFNPDTTFIISTPTLWRPFSYYLNEYQLTDLSGLENPQPAYIYTRENIKEQYMWEFQNKSLTVNIPGKITTVVFTDDSAYSWIKNYPYKTYKLPGNSFITSISVSSLDKILYNYHSVKIVK